MGVKLPPFQAVFEAQRTDVYRFLVATAGPVDADDCFQETWLAALRAYPRLRRADNLRGWLLKIAQNKAIDAHRARKRAPLPVEEIDPPAAGAAVEAALPDEQLWHAARELPGRQRTAVVLRFTFDLAFREVGQVMDSSEEAARRNVFEGLKKLRKVYA